ncbi:unnamed protein product [Aphis gossypii]|uniref:Secreted protein n=1 Tax=Aphis gossypii TaxID=80765 RepID=A0A9P0IKC8_APHGO|nr:unnamed protein product [Aphis gossypii]
MFFFFFLFHIFQSVHLGRALDTFFVCINARFGVTPVEGAPCRTSSFPAGRRVFRWVKRDGRCAGVSWPTMWLSVGGGVRVAESVRRAGWEEGDTRHSVFPCRRRPSATLVTVRDHPPAIDDYDDGVAYTV